MLNNVINSITSVLRNVRRFNCKSTCCDAQIQFENNNNNDETKDKEQDDTNQSSHVTQTIVEV